jgi:hypothetical protein
VNLGQAYGWYAQVGKYIIPRKLEVAVRYGFMDPSTQQVNDLVKEFGAAINYSFDGTYNNRLVVDYSNITLGSGGRAPTGSRSRASRDSDATLSRTESMSNISFFSRQPEDVTVTGGRS